MEASSVRTRLENIIRRVLHEPSFVLVDQALITETNGWDSMSHIQIIFRTEKEFSVKFKIQEVSDLRKGGELLALVETKLSKKAAALSQS